MYVLGALAGLALLGPGAARAQQAAGPGGFGGGTNGASNGGTSGSGGPGTLGTEAPNDSAVAQGYIHSRTPVRGDSDHRLADGIRQLLVENRRAMEQAKQSVKASDPEQAKAAQKVVDARGIAEFNLLKGAQESGFELGEGEQAGFAAVGSMGSDSADLPSYATVNGTPSTAIADTSTNSSGSSSDASTGSSSSTSEPNVQNHASTASDLVRDARDSHRLQLASSLEEAKKALDDAANAMASVSSSSSNRTSSSAQ
jgi:hypothetical protein